MTWAAGYSAAYLHTGRRWVVQGRSCQAVTDIRIVTLPQLAYSRRRVRDIGR